MIQLSTKLARIRSETHQQVTELAEREGLSFADALESIVRREGETADVTPLESELNSPIEYEELPQNEEENSSAFKIVAGVFGRLVALAYLARR